MTRTLHLDLESYSTIDLTETGVHVYAEHPTTDIHCVSYAIDDEKPQTWAPLRINFKGAPLILDPPDEIIAAVEIGWEICAHNAAFERTMWRHILTPRYGWPSPKLTQWRCTMVQALAMALPASLKNATRAVGIDDGGKADDGRTLMLQMCKPRRPRKRDFEKCGFKQNEDPKRIYWHHEDPDGSERLARLYKVCEKDVEDERELDKRTLRLTPSELALWHLDQRINDRGVFVDINLCHAALKIVTDAEHWLNKEITELTDGDVTAFTNVAQIARWCRLQGCPTESLTKDAVEDLLARKDLSPVVRRVLEIRLEGAKAAVKKLNALARGRSRDGRAKGLLQFHSASTGRWAGRRFQPQNIKRPDLDDVEGAIGTIASGDADFVRLTFGEPLAVVADCIRGVCVAAPGNILYAADFSNIEGRLQAWLAGEEWKLDAFRRQDDKTGPEVYKLMAAKILTKLRGTLRLPESITKPERQAYGKVSELALGYQGGVGAFQKMAVNYGVEMTDVQADEIKCSWREEHPNIKQCWYALEEAAKLAIQRHGYVFRVGAIAFRAAGSFLFMRLPSGRCICYPYPGIKPKLMPWKDRNGDPVWKDSIRYMGTDTYTHKWSEQWAHGGLLFNNAVQGMARDIEAEAMQRVEAAGYWNILSVHDEIVCETKSSFGSVEEFVGLMTVLPKWASGLPLAAAGWRAERYKKE